MTLNVRSSRPRFYTTVAAVKGDGGGFIVTLDGEAVKTPQGRLLSLPNEALAEAVAEEWRQQEASIVPEKMPLTKLANTAIDGVASRMAEVVADVVRYASSDLICYRANVPRELAERQSAAWDPVLKWVYEEYHALFEVTQGIGFVQQRPLSLSILNERCAALSPFQLAALQVMTALTGSALLALAHTCGRLSLADAWSLAHIDEDWQEHQWGQDYEASRRKERRYREMAAASRFFALAS